MRHLIVFVAFAALLLSGCDQQASTDKPAPAAETSVKPADTPGTAEKPTPAAPADTTNKADKKPNPCQADRKAICPDAKAWNEVLACFKLNKDRVSEACKASVKLD